MTEERKHYIYLPKMALVGQDIDKAEFKTLLEELWYGNIVTELQATQDNWVDKILTEKEEGELCSVFIPYHWIQNLPEVIPLELMGALLSGSLRVISICKDLEGETQAIPFIYLPTNVPSSIFKKSLHIICRPYAYGGLCLVNKKSNVTLPYVIRDEEHFKKIPDQIQKIVKGTIKFPEELSFKLKVFFNSLCDFVESEPLNSFRKKPSLFTIYNENSLCISFTMRTFTTQYLKWKQSYDLWEKLSTVCSLFWIDFFNQTKEVVFNVYFSLEDQIFMPTKIGFDYYSPDRNEHMFKFYPEEPPELITYKSLDESELSDKYIIKEEKPSSQKDHYVIGGEAENDFTQRISMARLNERDFDIVKGTPEKQLGNMVSDGQVDHIVDEYYNSKIGEQIHKDPIMLGTIGGFNSLILYGEEAIPGIESENFADVKIKFFRAKAFTGALTMVKNQTFDCIFTDWHSDFGQRLIKHASERSLTPDKKKVIIVVIDQNLNEKIIKKNKDKADIFIRAEVDIEIIFRAILKISQKLNASKKKKK